MGSGPFEQFVAPLAAADLLDPASREKMPLQHGVCEHFDPQVFDWERMLDVAVKSMTNSKFRVTRDRERVPTALLQTAGQTDRKKLEALLSRSASVVLPAAHRYDERLAAIARDYEAASGAPVRLGAIASTGTAGALKRHADQVTIFIVQIEGAKHWRIYRPGENGRSEQPVFDGVLSAGSFLLVPEGMPHECDTVGARSLHLGLSFAGPNYKTWG